MQQRGAGESVCPPKDDVNRLVTLPSCRKALQQTFWLDSVFPRPNPMARAKRAQGCRKGRATNEKGTPERALHSLFLRRFRQAGQAFGADSALMREVRRDILRASVFLWTTPLVTPRAISGWAAL
jgi:hypothetical protein